MPASRDKGLPRRASASRRWLQRLAGAGATLGIILLLGGGLCVLAYLAPGPSSRGGARAVILRRGAGVAEVAGELAQAGVVRSRMLFIAAAEATRAAPRLKAGEYAFPSRASLAQVLRMLRLGEIVHHKITIPEGLTSQQVVDILNGSDLLVGQIPTPPEGSILPQTYEVVRGEERASVLKRMMEDRDRMVGALWAHHRQDLPFRTAEEAVTLASIVEKETGLASERPRIAAVYVNRLRRGMRLQADPTVIYGITGGAPLGRGIRLSELTTLTPYNTYMVPGLPPGPIDNPGEAALAAAMDPPTTGELYFVANGTGGHAFAATLEDHARNVARWRGIERARSSAAPASSQASAPASAPGRG